MLKDGRFFEKSVLKGRRLPVSRPSQCLLLQHCKSEVVRIRVRTNHSHLNAYLARIQQIESPRCECDTGIESVKHVIVECPQWAAQRSELRLVASERWGDVSFLLGGKSSRLGAATGKHVDGEMWRPDLRMVRATIAFLKSTGRFTAQEQVRATQ